MKKKSFVLHTEYEKHIRKLSMEERGILLTSIFAKVNGNALPDLPPAVDMAFGFIEAQLDRDLEKYEETCERRREAGKLGGAPKGNKNATKNNRNNQKVDLKKEEKKPLISTVFTVEGTDEKQPKQAKQPDNDNENDSDNDNENDNDGAKAPYNAHVRARWTPPTLSEIQAYCFERGNRVDPEHFFDHYSANGWKVGLAPMQDWKAALRNWERREKGVKSYNLDDFFEAAVGKGRGMEDAIHQ